MQINNTHNYNSTFKLDRIKQKTDQKLICNIFVKSSEKGKLLKPVQTPPRGQRELDFYSKLFSSKSDSTDKKIRRHLPVFFGVKDVPVKNCDSQTAKYLVLQDLTEGFEEPNILGF